jgi:hypothetical protein
MSIKAGSILFYGGTALLDRLQTVGPGQVNINRAKVYEVGSRLSVGSVADTPDLSFTAESFDVSAEMEAVLLGRTFSSLVQGAELSIASAIPFDVVSPFLPAASATTPDVSVGSAAIPHLTLESLSYKFGIGENASQTATLKGSDLYYTPAGSSYVESFTGSGSAGQACIVAHYAVPYNGDTTSGTRYALSVSLSDGSRLTYGSDYTETITAGSGIHKTLQVNVTAAVSASLAIKVLYASNTTGTYGSGVHTAESATRPAAIRGRNIEVFINGELLANRWTSVQSVGADWKVSLQKDEEFSNPNLVSQDFDVPDLSGTLELKARDYAELYSKICVVAGVTAGEVAGPLTTAPMEFLIKLKSPTSGAVLKQLKIDDARFNLPGYSAKVQSKLTSSFTWMSDTGDLTVIHGEAGS